MFRLNLLCLIMMYTCMAREPPMVTIPNQGQLIGKEISKIRTHRIIGFLGIPYARPPVGNLRFAYPATDPLPSWEEPRNATEFELPCLQTADDFKPQDVPFLNLISPSTSVNISEDCLYLNVFKPYGTPPKDGYATIVWFHPGNFTTGNPSLWDPYRIVYQQKVIVVTFAWRMNIMGFFTTLDGEAPGNYGLMDQQAAMQWVKQNIKIFDGNPKNICLMGYGAGAMSIGLHMINPESKNLFQKAILMSGNFLTPSAVKFPPEDKDIPNYLGEYFGCLKSSTALLIDCLRNVDGHVLVGLTSHVDWRPLIDRGLSNTTAPFLPEPPRNFYERKEYARIPVLTGYTNMEDVLSLDSLNNNDNLTSDNIQTFLYDLVTRDLPQINETERTQCVYNHEHIMDSAMFFFNPSIPYQDSDRVRRAVADFYTERYYGASTILHANFMSRYKPTYVYRFDLKPSTIAATANIPEWISVPHLFDLIYVWGLPYWVQLPENEWDGRDKQTSDIIMTFWANFAKYSDPTVSLPFPIVWDAYTKESPSILIIDNKFTMSDDRRTNYKSFEFWNDYYPKVLELATQCCNATEIESGGDYQHPRVDLIWVLFLFAHGLLILPVII